VAFLFLCEGREGMLGSVGGGKDREGEDLSESSVVVSKNWKFHSKIDEN
jgi:hypothetical protein